jgi:hypothetical protein
VYEAIQDHPHRRVAIKFLRNGIASSRADLMRFRREADILGRVRHPNIVTIHEAGVASGSQYFVMDYIAGLPLDVHVRDAALSVEETVCLFATICDAVSAAHQHGVLHRDLKPANILVDENGEPHVLDFGLAASADPAHHHASLTIPGQFIGSILWASPEHVSGNPASIDVRSDVYAMGLILYSMLAGQLPYRSFVALREQLQAIAHDAPTPPRAFQPDIPKDLELITLKCLSKEPQRRYQSAAELSADLRRLLAQQPIIARGDSTWYVLSKIVRRHRQAIAVAVALALITVFYAGTMTVLYRRALLAQADARTSAQEADESAHALEAVYENLLDRIAKLERSPGTEAMRRELVGEAYRGVSKLVKKKLVIGQYRLPSRPLYSGWATLHLSWDSAMKRSGISVRQRKSARRWSTTSRTTLTCGRSYRSPVCESATCSRNLVTFQVGKRCTNGRWSWTSNWPWPRQAMHTFWIISRGVTSDSRSWRAIGERTKSPRRILTSSS